MWCYIFYSIFNLFIYFVLYFIDFILYILFFILYAVTHTQFHNIGPHRDNLNAIASPMRIPQNIINEGYTPDENIAESSFTQSATAMEYCIRLVEDIELLHDGNVTMVSKGNLKFRP